MSSPCPPTPLHPAPPCPALQRHARDIDERRNRLTQEQVAQRNKALHRTMQASNGRAAGLWPRLRPWLSGAEQDLLWLPWLLITVKTVPQNCPPNQNANRRPWPPLLAGAAARQRVHRPQLPLHQLRQGEGNVPPRHELPYQAGGQLHLLQVRACVRVLAASSSSGSSCPGCAPC